MDDVCLGLLIILFFGIIYILLRLNEVKRKECECGDLNSKNKVSNSVDVNKTL